MGCRMSRTIADDPCKDHLQSDDGYQVTSSADTTSSIDKRSATTTTTPKTYDSQTKETESVCTFHEGHNNDDVVNRQQHNNFRRKIVLSTRFPVNHISYFGALDFKNLFKDDPFIRQGNFELFEHDTYDNNCWTGYEWLLRGTILTDTDDKSFRKQLDEVKATGGFMIQFMEEEVDNKCCLGNKQDLETVQKIQRDMAEQLEVKIFRVYRSSTKEIYLHPYHINRIITEIRNWYENGCRDDMSECVIHAEIFRRKARVKKPLGNGRLCCCTLGRCFWT